MNLYDPNGERLQKILAHAGVGSRRLCENLIAQGRVTVNDQVVTELGIRVNPDTVRIHVDGTPIQTDASKLTIALYKPPGVVSTMEDELGRPALSQYVADRPERLFHVGRLDQDTEGLILLSNDGELTHRLTHPSYKVPKTYVARVEGTVTRGLGKVLEKGVQHGVPRRPGSATLRCPRRARVWRGRNPDRPDRATAGQGIAGRGQPGQSSGGAALAESVGSAG